MLLVAHFFMFIINLWHFLEYNIFIKYSWLSIAEMNANYA